MRLLEQKTALTRNDNNNIINMLLKYHNYSKPIQEALKEALCLFFCVLSRKIDAILRNLIFFSSGVKGKIINEIEKLYKPHRLRLFLISSVE